MLTIYISLLFVVFFMLAVSLNSLPVNVTEQYALLPNPSNPSSYSYSTAGSEDDILSLTGPFENETLVLVTVKALAPITADILISAGMLITNHRLKIGHFHQ